MQRRDLELGIDVQRTLNAALRPLLNVDAGDIEITSVSDGHVVLAPLGSCARCAFKPACMANRCLPLLAERFADRGATFEISGVPTPRNLLEVALYRAGVKGR